MNTDQLANIKAVLEAANVPVGVHLQVMSGIAELIDNRDSSLEERVAEIEGRFYELDRLDELEAHFEEAEQRIEEVEQRLDNVEGDKLDPNSIRYQHSLRFRKVANNYALQVTRAYDGDQAAAARDDDTTVAERVRQYEIANGIEPKDWVKIGQVDEGREDDIA